MCVCVCHLLKYALYRSQHCLYLSLKSLQVEEPALLLENTSESQLHTGRGARTLH